MRDFGTKFYGPDATPEIYKQRNTHLTLPILSQLWHLKGKVKVCTLDITPLRQSSPHKHSGMARVHKGSHSFTCTSTCLSAIGMSHTCLCLPSHRWYSFTDPGGWKAELAWVAGYVVSSETVYLPKGSHHPNTNRAQCRATALIKTKVLPLH